MKNKTDELTVKLEKFCSLNKEDEERKVLFLLAPYASPSATLAPSALSLLALHSDDDVVVIATLTSWQHYDVTVAVTSFPSPTPALNNSRGLWMARPEQSAGPVIVDVGTMFSGCPSVVVFVRAGVKEFCNWLAVGNNIVRKTPLVGTFQQSVYLTGIRSRCLLAGP